MGLFKRKKSTGGDSEKSEPDRDAVNPEVIRKQHHDELSNTFIAGSDWNDNDLWALTIQDLCVLIGNAKWAREKQVFVNADELLTKRIEKFYKLLIEKVKSADLLYIIIDETTDYPFVDENAYDCIWMFSEKAFAENAADYYRQQYRRFRVENVRNESLTAFFGDIFYMAGAAGIYVDNGLAGCMIQKEDLLEPPDWSGIPAISIPVMNPSFMLAHIKMSQEIRWHVNYPNREQVLDKLESELSRQSVSAKFLVPVKNMPECQENVSSVLLEKDTIVSIPRLIRQDSSAAIPAFTDWKQFGLCYSDKEYAGWIMSFDDLAAMIMSDKDHPSVVINAGKCSMEISARSVERIRSVLTTAFSKE